MDDRDIERRYLRWGASLKRGDRHLGRYGQGGKAAIGHLGNSFLIEAGRPGSEYGWRFADPERRVHEIVVMALSLRRRRRKAAGRQLRLVR